LRINENRMLRRTFGFKRNGVSGGWGKLMIGRSFIVHILLKIRVLLR
jgi:hypothetical protein